MAEKVMMIALSPTMEKGTIVKWRKKVGEKVNMGDVICDVETDKAVMEYESLNEGVLLQITVGENAQAQIGETIAFIGSAGEDTSGLTTESPTEKSNAAPAKSSLDKISLPASSTINSQIPPGKSNERVKASPLARKLAKQQHIDLETLSGSGPAGRIIKKDLDGALNAGSQGSRHTPDEASDEVILLSDKRRVIAKRLTESKFSAPHYYLKISVQVDGLLKARKDLNESGSQQKVSFNAFLLKMVAEAIKKNRLINSSWQDDSIKVHGRINLGLAVAQKDGLITPVVRDCGNKGIMAIDRELQVLIAKALENKLRPEEFSGQTFTISNLGSYGIDEFTAIINPPDSAILAVGAVKKEPLVSPGGTIEVKSLLKLTLSLDHRVIDGAVAAEFMRTLKNIIENPVSVLY